MKIDKLKKYESKKQSEITPEHHQKNVERVVDMIMSVYERLPANPAPVVESFQELARQAKAGIVRQPTIIDSGETQNASESATKNASEVATKTIMSDAENSPENKFTETELQILEKLKNE